VECFVLVLIKVELGVLTEVECFVLVLIKIVLENVLVLAKVELDVPIEVECFVLELIKVELDVDAKPKFLQSKRKSKNLYAKRPPDTQEPTLAHSHRNTSSKRHLQDQNSIHLDQFDYSYTVRPRL
jgi:hypothetical protein